MNRRQRWIREFRRKNRGEPWLFNFVNAEYPRGKARSLKAVLDAINTNFDNHLPVVVGVVEAKYLDLNHATLPQGWDAIQVSDQGEAKRGVAFLYDTANARVVDWHLEFTTDGGSETLDRYALEVTVVIDGKWYDLSVAHTVPKRAGFKIWSRQVGRWRALQSDISVGDMNNPYKVVARAWGRRVSQREVMAFVSKWKYKISKVYAKEIGVDHPVVGIIVWPKRKNRRRK